MLIHGNPENKNKSTDQIVIETLKEKMGEETREIDLNRTHRLGALKNNKVWPIIVKFARYSRESRVFKNTCTGGNSQYFNLERGARHGDGISACLFMLPLEIFFLHINKKSRNNIILPSLTLQAAILVLTYKTNNIYNLLNHILFAFKYYVYRSKEKHILNIDILIDNLIEIKKKEKQTCLVINNKTETYSKELCITDNVLLVSW